MHYLGVDIDIALRDLGFDPDQASSRSELDEWVARQAVPSGSLATCAQLSLRLAAMRMGVILTSPPNEPVPGFEEAGGRLAPERALGLVGRARAARCVPRQHLRAPRLRRALLPDVAHGPVESLKDAEVCPGLQGPRAGPECKEALKNSSSRNPNLLEPEGAPAGTRFASRAVMDPLSAGLLATGIVSDPWLDGEPRFRTRPVLLSEAEDRALRAAAEAVAILHDEVARLCRADPSLLESFFGMTPFQRLMAQASAPAWHGLARADVFVTGDGVAVCELNSDTPSGEAEAVLLNALAPRPAGARDPNAELEERYCELVGGDAGPITVGILYPTEIVEDLSMIVLYRRWFEARGWRVVLGSPYNLGRAGGRPALFGAPCDVFVRHYKTDWWGERESVWLDDEPFADAAPLSRQLAILLESDAPVVNPFGAVITQNKRALALMWEDMDRFPAWAQALIRRYVPYSARLEALHADALAERASWVLKSDYGCEGTEVVIGADCAPEEWAQALARARPGRWIAQRRFLPRADADGTVVNHGVYVVGGVAAGYFSRVHRGATDYAALAAPTFIEEPP
jgi:hypothetical protein